MAEAPKSESESDGYRAPISRRGRGRGIKRRGRPRKSSLPPRRSSLRGSPAITGMSESEGGDSASGTATNATPNLEVPLIRRRGRRPRELRGSLAVDSEVLDDNGNVLHVENDEYVMEPDEAGEQKVLPSGQLQGGREYKCRTFTILGGGDRLYMLATEPARAMGFRDSYLFFLSNRKLYKVQAEDELKADLIERQLMPPSYRNRQITLVTARSVFRQFGARMIVGGRKVTDDYWEKEARESGAVEGELVDPMDALQNKEYGKGKAGGGWQLYNLAREKKRKVQVTNENYMLEHARAASTYNSLIASERKSRWETGIYEPHTDIRMFPANTQPTMASWSLLPSDPSPTFVDESGRYHMRTAVTIDTVVKIPPFVMCEQGLLGVDPEVYASVDDNIKHAIEEQKEKEMQWASLWEGGEKAHGLRNHLRIL